MWQHAAVFSKKQSARMLIQTAIRRSWSNHYIDIILIKNSASKTASKPKGLAGHSEISLVNDPRFGYVPKFNPGANRNHCD